MRQDVVQRRQACLGFRQGCGGYRGKCGKRKGAGFPFKYLDLELNEKY